jgi:hypothetical protein
MRRIAFFLWLLVLGAPLLLFVTGNQVCTVGGVCWLFILAFFGGRLMPRWMRRYVDAIVKD